MRTKVNMMKDIFFHIYFNNPIYSSLQLRDLIIHTQLVSQSMSRSNAKPPIEPIQRNPQTYNEFRSVDRHRLLSISKSQRPKQDITSDAYAYKGKHIRGQHTLTAQLG